MTPNNSKLGDIVVARIGGFRGRCADAWEHVEDYICFRTQSFPKRDWYRLPKELSGLPRQIYLGYNGYDAKTVPHCYIEVNDKLYPVRVVERTEFMFAVPPALLDCEVEKIFRWFRKRRNYYLRHGDWFHSDIDERIGLLAASKRKHWESLFMEWFGADVEAQSLSLDEVLKLREKITPTPRMRVYSLLSYGREFLSFWFKADSGWEETPVQAVPHKGLPYPVSGISSLWNRGLLSPVLKVRFGGRNYQIVICDQPYFRFWKPFAMPQEKADELFTWVRRYHDVLIGLWHVCDESGISSTEFWHAVDDTRGIEWASKLKPVR